MAKQQNWDSNTESECKLLELIYSTKLLRTVICYTVESPIKWCPVPAQQRFTIDILKVEGIVLILPDEQRFPTSYIVTLSSSLPMRIIYQLTIPMYAV